MASNTKKETWFLHRIHELILNTLVSESRGTWIARISSIETAFLLLLLFFLSFFLFFYLFVLKRFETTRARYFQNETFQRRRNVRRTRRCTLYVLCEWVCTCNYYFNGGMPGLPVRHFNFFPVTFSIFFFFHFVSFGLLSFSIVICDRISTCIIQYSYINRATPMGLRLERPSTLFSIFLLLFLRVNSLCVFCHVVVEIASLSYMCISCLCICVTSVFKYIVHFFLFFFHIFRATSFFFATRLRVNLYRNMCQYMCI